MDVCEALDLRDAVLPVVPRRRRHACRPRSGRASADRACTSRWPASDDPRWRLRRCGVDVVGAAVAGGGAAAGSGLALRRLVVKLTSSGPILYRQTGVGRIGVALSPRCLKFRTTHEGAHDQQIQLLLPANHQDGPAFKIDRRPARHEGRADPAQARLDELPQSGQRALRRQEPRRAASARPERGRAVLPGGSAAASRSSSGMTCVWQVYGRNRVSFKRWVEMDPCYIDNWSLWMDFKLICEDRARGILRGTRDATRRSALSARRASGASTSRIALRRGGGSIHRGPRLVTGRSILRSATPMPRSSFWTLLSSRAGVEPRLDGEHGPSRHGGWPPALVFVAADVVHVSPQPVAGPVHVVRDETRRT